MNKTQFLYYAFKAIFLISCSIFLIIYGFTIFVALATSGSDLMKDPEAYYAALAPIIYCLFCIASGLGIIPSKKMLPLGIGVHLLAAPSIFISFLKMGFWLPLIAVLWIVNYIVRNSRNT